MAAKITEVPKEETRPTLVRFLGRNYNITYSDIDSGMTNLGLTHLNEGLVNIRNSQPPVEERDTVLHEFIHVVSHVMEIDLDERQVTVLAHGLTAIFQDNPSFGEYITGKL